MMLHTLLLLASASLVLGHGRVTQPPSRASAWRLGFPTPANYDDDGLNCGGFATQWSSNGGKCGMCGDAYSILPPRPHELGGTYGLGVIVAKYLPGAIIATTTQLTASHMGYWEFKLCPDPTDNSEECFDKHILVTEDGETKYIPKRGSGVYEVNYKLPTGLICEHCVLLWRYVAGNNWGICSNGTSGLGCGNQEEFRACSDIAIGVSKTSNDIGNIPPSLLFYLQKGYFELDKGHLISKDPKRPSAPQRPSRPRPSNRQPKTSNLQPQPQWQHQPSNQQPPTSNRQAQPSKQQQKTWNQQSQLFNRQPQTFNQYFQPSKPQTSNQHFQPNQQTQPLNRQLQSSNRQTQTSNRQPPPSNPQQQITKQQHQQFYLQTQPAKQQPYPSNPQPQTSIRQLQPSKQQLQVNQQPHRSKPQPQSSKRKPKSSKRQPNTAKHQPSPSRYEFKTSNKRKTKQAKSKKKKKAHGQHGKQKTRSQRYKYL